jgi:hypothetical protein
VSAVTGVLANMTVTDVDIQGVKMLDLLLVE